MNKMQTIVIICCCISIIVGCGNIKPECARAEEIVEASYIGQKHNEILDDFFSHYRSSRSASNNNTWESEFQHMFPDIPATNIISIPLQERETRSLIDEIAQKGLLDPDAEPYIREIDQILADPPDTSEELEALFCSIENRIPDTLPHNTTEQIRSYLETARASLHYWSINLARLSEEFLGAPQESDRAVTKEKVKAWWTANKRKIAMCIASDACGAAAGAAAGCATGLALGSGGVLSAPATAITGTVLGAISSGVASSIQGFMTEKFVVVVPYIKTDKPN